MKKLVLLAVLLSMSTGCGRGWFPHLFRGAPCGGTCAQPVNHSCEGCPNYSGGYGGGYEGVVNEGGYVDGGYVDGGAVGTGQVYQTLPPAMAPLTPPTSNVPR